MWRGGGKRGRKEVGNHPSSSRRLKPTQSCTRSPQEGSPRPGPLGRVCMSVLTTRSSPVGPFRPPPASSLSPWFSTRARASCHLVTLARVLLIGLHRALPECLMVLSDDPRAWAQNAGVNEEAARLGGFWPVPEGWEPLSNSAPEEPDPQLWPRRFLLCGSCSRSSRTLMPLGSRFQRQRLVVASHLSFLLGPIRNHSTCARTPTAREPSFGC